jgi:DNA (cytosine-5)-methyltransferase 1
MSKLTCVEIRTGAGGQALGLERAGFEPEALIEVEAPCCSALRENRRKAQAA